jgi:epoxide hydrolase-like predicted phosphatase
MNSPVVVFDLGKVLVDFDYSIAARKVAARSAKSMSDLVSLLAASPLINQYETGLVTRQQFFETIRDTIGYQGDLAEFGGHFADIFTEIPAMTALQASLRRRGIRTFILSNTNDLAVEHIERNFPFFKNFDGYIYSFKVGAMKPDARIYQALEAMCGLAGADIVYLDDLAANVAAGAARGWRTVLHVSPDKTRAALESLGLA